MTEMSYDIQDRSTILFGVEALNGPRQQVLSETLRFEPSVSFSDFSSDVSQNRITRVSIAGPCKLSLHYTAEVDNACEVTAMQSDLESSLDDLPAAVHPYLYPSRYCQSDKLYRFAQHGFGHIDGAFAKVAAITNWIFQNVQYTGGFTNSQTSAYDTVTELVGVCRDFAHLGIALTRALSIPARYFTAYAFKLRPGDFHACFEAYINGSWQLFDPTFLVPLNGLVKIATGRDAADTSVATMYGTVGFMSMRVDCQALDSGFIEQVAGFIPGHSVSYP